MVNNIPVVISNEVKNKIIQELKWRFQITEKEIIKLIDEVISYVDSIEEIVKTDKIESESQAILKLVYEHHLKDSE